MNNILNLPPQQLPFNKKNREWRKKHLDWASNRSYDNYSPVRQSVRNKKINYNLLEGKLHMPDLERVLNPDRINAKYIPNTIQYYPIINSKLEVLRGEEYKRLFEYQVVLSDPNSISEKEDNKKKELLNSLQEALVNSSSEEEYNKQLEKIDKYYKYEWQDSREIRANTILKHYSKELNMPMIFNTGFMDALTVGEEIYQCDIVSGEPTLERLNPLKIRIFRSGYSNRIEDADVIVLEDYWSPSKIIDTYYESLSSKDIKYLENYSSGKPIVDSMSNIDERVSFINTDDEIYLDNEFEVQQMLTNVEKDSLSPYDTNGNIRVIRMYWKSRRRIKEVKSYNPETGEEEYNFYPENHIIDKNAGEEERIFYINEAWEGTKIGEDIYVNMRPRLVQYNRIFNPSRCHFGIIGSVYNLNDGKPFSLVEKMKPYSYFYSAVHDRLNKTIARNFGKLVRLDLAKVPKGWDVEKWMYFAQVNGILVEDSFKEGNVGPSTGVLAGALNNASSGVVDAEVGNSIQFMISILEFTKMEMSEVAGISKQREGQISNRETVGGVERATLQSSYITEWLFAQHDDVKKRTIEAFLETAKVAFKGRNKKFQYLLSDNSLAIMNVDGDEFAEADYGLVVDNGSGTQELNQKLDMLAQAALQNQKLSFSSVMKLYGSSSLIEKQRLIEQDEAKIQEQLSQSQQQQMELEKQNTELLLQQKQAELELAKENNIRDNETKVLVASMNLTKDDGIQEPEYTNENKERLLEQIREFDAKIALDKSKLELEKRKHIDNMAFKNKELNTRKNKE